MRPIEEAFEMYCETCQITDLSMKTEVRKVFYSGAHSMFMLYGQILLDKRTGIIIERLVEADLERYSRGD